MTDLWTSPHWHAMLTICAQWINNEYNLRKTLITLPEYWHDHSKKHQTKFIFDCIRNYEITHNINCHTSDNMSSNDTCVRSLHKWLSEIDINWDTSKNCMRCLRHIINLSLQTFLFAKSKKTLKAAINATIENTNRNINDAILKSFARTLSKPNARSKASQATLQVKIKKCKCGQQKNTTSIEDFSGIETLPTLQKFHKLVMWVRNFFLHSNLWDEAVNFCLDIDNSTH